MDAKKNICSRKTQRAVATVSALKNIETNECWVGYLKFLAVTKRNSYAIKAMAECSDFLSNSATFFKLDANSIYWQIKVDQANGDKTNSISRHDLYLLIQISLKLLTLLVCSIKKNGCETVYHQTKICPRIRGQYCGILEWSRKKIKYVCHILDFLSNVMAALKLKKCNLSINIINNIGH